MFSEAIGSSNKCGAAAAAKEVADGSQVAICSKNWSGSSGDMQQ